MVGIAASLGAIVAIPLVVIVAAHLIVLPGRIADAQDFNDAGHRQFGPSNPVVDPIYDAVLEFTPADSVVAFYRARTMTLLTDRRSFQTKDLDRILQSADFYAERRDSKYWQPTLDEDHEGLVEVWSDPRWTSGLGSSLCSREDSRCVDDHGGAIRIHGARRLSHLQSRRGAQRADMGDV